MSALAQLAIALVLLVAGFGAGVRWHAGQDAIAAQEAREQVERQRRFDEKRVDVAAAGHQADEREIRTEFITITEEVERVVEKPVYRDVCLDDDGLRALRAAIGPGAAASEPARAVPGPAATD